MKKTADTILTNDFNALTKEEIRSLTVAESSVRKKLNKVQRQIVCEVYTETTLANKSDDGRYGKVFENDVRQFLVNNSTVFGCQPQGDNDVQFYINGKKKIVECKTGSGTLVNGIKSTENEKMTLEWYSKKMNFDYIVYSPDSDINNTKVFTKEEFFTLLFTYNLKKPYTLLKINNKKGSRCINLNLSDKKRKEYFTTAELGYTLQEFKELKEAGKL